MHGKIITQIEKIRRNNNKNWMNLLRIAFKYAPDETGLVMKKINKCDMQINALVGKLSKLKKYNSWKCGHMFKNTYWKSYSFV